VLPSGSSPGNNSGVKVHGYDETCKITINWSKVFNQDPDQVEALYTKEEKKNKDIQREINTKKDHIRKLKATADEIKQSTFYIDLPFQVIETQDPDFYIIEASMKENGVTNTTRILRIRLDRKFVSAFAVSKVKEDVKFEL
jgi:hypothetical protein